jgi:two-component system nitrate/nitrite sensor histidine kinase NarQ
MLENGQSQPVLNELEEMNTIISRAVDDVRRSIASLQAAPQPRQSLQEALDCLLEGNEQLCHPATLLHDWLGTPLFLPEDQLHQVVRIVQEALLNAQRHANARQITITLEQRDSSFAIIIEDDGQGFDTQLALNNGDAHFGLDIMSARAAQIEGTLEIKSRTDHGTRITLLWPPSENEPGHDKNEIPSTLVQELFSAAKVKER